MSTSRFDNGVSFASQESAGGKKEERAVVASHGTCLRSASSPNMIQGPIRGSIEGISTWKIHAWDVIWWRKACFDLGALGIVILANGDAASPIGWEEHLRRRGESPRPRVADWRWCSSV